MNYEHPLESEIAVLRARILDLEDAVMAVRLWHFAQPHRLIPHTLDGLLARLVPAPLPADTKEGA